MIWKTENKEVRFSYFLSDYQYINNSIFVKLLPGAEEQAFLKPILPSWDNSWSTQTIRQYLSPMLRICKALHNFLFAPQANQSCSLQESCAASPEGRQYEYEAKASAVSSAERALPETARFEGRLSKYCEHSESEPILAVSRGKVAISAGICTKKLWRACFIANPCECSAPEFFPGRLQQAGNTGKALRTKNRPPPTGYHVLLLQRM